MTDKEKKRVDGNTLLNKKVVKCKNEMDEQHIYRGTTRKTKRCFNPSSQPFKACHVPYSINGP